MWQVCLRWMTLSSDPTTVSRQHLPTLSRHNINNDWNKEKFLWDKAFPAADSLYITSW